MSESQLVQGLYMKGASDELIRKAKKSELHIEESRNVYRNLSVIGTVVSPLWMKLAALPLEYYLANLSNPDLNTLIGFQNNAFVSAIWFLTALIPIYLAVSGVTGWKDYPKHERFIKDLTNVLKYDRPINEEQIILEHNL